MTRVLQFTIFFAAVPAMLLAPPAARANIDLELQQSSFVGCAGEEFMIDLVAYSDNAGIQTTSGMDVILTWKRGEVELIGVDDGSNPYAWAFSGFPDDSQNDDLNGTFSDGTALYAARLCGLHLSSGTPAASILRSK